MNRIKYIKKGKYIPIKEYEPNKFVRYSDYYNVSNIKIDIIEHKDNHNNIKYIKRISKQVKTLKKILERRNWKKFGDALTDKNSSLTTLGKEIKMNFIKNIEKKSNTQKEFKIKSNKIYKPKLNINIINSKSNLFNSSKYNNKLIKKFSTTSIFISNLPKTYSKDELYDMLYNELYKYGTIKSIKLLTNHNNKLKGIGFLNFQSEKDTIKFLNTKKYISIDSLIINFEKGRSI